MHVALRPGSYTEISGNMSKKTVIQTYKRSQVERAVLISQLASLGVDSM
jgi:hypothetical protein